ncbi:copper resistance protein B [Caulobacter sp. LARHSG274]
MKAALLLVSLLAAPAAAQTMDHAGHAMPATPPPAATPQTAPAPMDHDGHAMPTPPEAAEQSPAGAPSVAEQQTPPPPAPDDHAADRYYDPAAMARARGVLLSEHGGATMSKVMANLFEYRPQSGADGYRWDGEAWFGGDINRLVVKTEGEGATGEGVEAAELQLLYSRAVTRYSDLQVGLRQDFKPGRTYASLGVETLLPYWIETQGALFLSDKGDLLGRLEGAYDLRLTQRWILQPRAELNFAAQDTPRTRTGSGLSTAELGLRLRYELRREFGPYVGVSYERSYGRTADYARAAGRDVDDASLVVGIRAWF